MSSKFEKLAASGNERRVGGAAEGKRKLTTAGAFKSRRDDNVAGQRELKREGWTERQREEGGEKSIKSSNMNWTPK